MITANYICRTEEDFEDLMQYLEDNGVLWNSNTKPTGWGVFDKDRVYCIEDNVMTYNDSFPKVPNIQEWVRGKSKQNGIVSGGNKVTKKELLEQLGELRNQIDTLNAKIKELDKNTEPNTRTNQWKVGHLITYMPIEK